MEDKIKETEIKVEAEAKEEAKVETEAKKKTATKKKTTSTKKKTTAKEEVKEEKKEAVDMSNMMTPEMMEMFMKFMESQQKTEVQTTEAKQGKWTKTSLYKIKDEVVEVKNVLDGKVVYVSPKSKIKYKWLEKGDVEVLTIEEILAMDSKKLYLRTPILVIEDERVIEGLGLGKLYQNIELLEDIHRLMELGESDLEKFINDLSAECKNNLRDEINKKIKRHEIRDYVTVEMLKRLLDL